MKQVWALLILLILFSCTDQKKMAELEQENQELKSDYSRLIEESQMKEDYIKEYTQTVNEVYDNLERIRKREGLLSKYSKDMEKRENVSIREKMRKNLESIDETLQKSKQQLTKLRKKASSSGKASAALQETVDKLQKVIEEKEVEIAELRRQTEDLNNHIARVEGQLTSAVEKIEQQTSALNTAFYIIGTEDELKEKGIIKEVGGILGLRKTKKLAEGFNKDELFTQTNILETEMIPINDKLKDVKLISPHSEDSFHLVANEDESSQIEIIDPDEFWKMRYLVIMTKG